MEALIVGAIPFFLVGMALEAAALRHAAHHDRVGYEKNDTRTSISMGLGHLVVGGAWKLVSTAIYAGIYVLSPWHLPTGVWWTWVALVFADDLAFDAFHRCHQRIRL